MSHGNDPKWTAFILGELETEERAAIKEAIECDPAGIESVEQIREVSVLIQESLKEYAPVELTAEQRQSILAAGSVTHFEDSLGTSRNWRRFWLAAAAAIVVLLAGVTAWRMARAQTPVANVVPASPRDVARDVQRKSQGEATRPIVMLDRTGRLVEEIAPPAQYHSFHLSPDGKWLTFEKEVSGTREIWLRDLEKGTLSRLTLGDGPLAWSSDGRFIVQKRDKSTGWDLWVASPQDRSPLPIVQSRADEQDAHFSPDGRWVAYTSNESGREEIVVLPYPKPGGKYQISAGGGNSPRWRRDGREIFYVSPTKSLMAVSVASSGNTLQASAPRQLFSLPPDASRFELTEDGERFILLGEPR
jgi:WD40-like Beta Propeller Repeat